MQWFKFHAIRGDDAQPQREHHSIFSASDPDAAEQRAIAHILGTLDDKIELNRRMNETLEAMVRAIKREWSTAKA